MRPSLAEAGDQKIKFLLEFSFSLAVKSTLKMN
jgi:hypothetical protein